MAYTYKQLTMAYTAVHGGIEPTGAVASQLLLLTNPSFTDAQRLSYILNGADQTTAVAVLSYQFFTGKAPTAAGIEYLVNSASNPTDLNDPIYAKFNLENRFMNFATNLALQGEAKAAFEAKYGAMTYAQYVASIYESIIGETYAKAAGLDPAKIVQDIIARQDLILLSARNNGVIGPNATQAEIDLALKAATAAYLLAEGIKADVGVYAGASNNFMLAIARGDAAYGTDILMTHTPQAGSGSTGKGQAVDNPPAFEDLPGAPQPEPQPQPVGGQTFTLTAGNDKFTGAGGDDTFNGTNLTFNFGDTLDGGAGDDTLVVTATPGSGVQYQLPNEGTTSIETIRLTSDGGVRVITHNYAGLVELEVTAGKGAMFLDVDTGVTVDVTVTEQANSLLQVYGGSDVTLNSAGATTGAINVGGSGAAITGDIVVTRELFGVANGGDINVTGGKTVSVTQTAVAPVAGLQTNSKVFVTGSALTTEVTVKAAEAFSAGGVTRAANTVRINDVNAGSASLAGTITKASVDSFTTLAFYGTALTDLSLAHGSGNITLDNSGLTTPTNKTLNLAVNALTGGTLDDADIYETLNVTTGATASTLANITFGALTTLEVEGDSKLTLTSTAGLTALETVTVKGAAGLTANLSGATVTSIDTTATTGTSTLTIDASKASFAGGAGVDKITLSSATVSKAVDLGGGDDTLTVAAGTTQASVDGGAGVDTLIMSADVAEDLSANPTFQFFGFEILELTGAGSQSVALATVSLNPGGTVRTAGGNGLTLINASNMATLELTGAGTSYNLLGSWGGANDALNVKLSNTSGGNVNFAQTSITAAGIETVNITAITGGPQNNGDFNWVTWHGNDVKTITVSGNGNVNLTSASTALTTVDASGLTQGNFSWGAGVLTGALVVKGSATGTNIIDLRDANANLTYTGGTGADVVTLRTGANTINLVADSAVDTIKVDSANTAAAYTTISGLQAGDQIVLNGFGGLAQPANMVAISGHSTLADYLAAGSVNSDGSVTRVEYFVIGGDTYLLYDRSAASGFQDETDALIKLTGVTTIGTYDSSTGTLTL